MTTTISTLGQQTLRRLGVRIVPLDDSPTLTTTVPVQYIATAALVELGIYNVYEASYPLETVAAADIATGALVELGVLNSDVALSLLPTVAPASIAAAALVELGVINSAETHTVVVVPQATIATGALIELGVIASDETPSTTDQALAFDKVTYVHGLLEAQGIASWTVSAIPGFFAEEYIKLTAAQAASSFGKSVDPAMVQLLEDRIRLGATVIHNGPSFMQGIVGAVHSSLQAKGIASWDFNSIPDAFGVEYTKLSAALAAASFGKAAQVTIGKVSTIDPDMVKVLEGRIQMGAIVMHNGPGFMQGWVLAAHDMLITAGIAPWSVEAVPRAFYEEYVKLTAMFAGSSFGRPPEDPALTAALVDRVRQGSSVMRVDQVFMLGKVASVHAALDAQGVVFWDGSAIPQAFAEEYIKLTVAHTAASLNKQIDPSIIPALEARIRKGVMVFSADDNANQAVQAVHDDLAMRGIARWTSFDIPDPVGPQYVVLAAARLAPLFEMQTDPRDTQNAMVAIYRYVSLPSSGVPVQVAYF